MLTPASARAVDHVIDGCIDLEFDDSEMPRPGDPPQIHPLRDVPYEIDYRLLYGATARIAGTLDEAGCFEQAVSGIFVPPELQWSMLVRLDNGSTWVSEPDPDHPRDPSALYAEQCPKQCGAR